MNFIKRLAIFTNTIMNKQIRSLQLTLTSTKIIFQKEKGIIHKEKELIDIIKLEDIKVYNNKVQIQQKSNEVNIQTINKNVKVSFYSVFKAKEFVTKIIDTITDTTITERNKDRIKNALNNVDDVLGIKSKDIIKGVVEKRYNRYNIERNKKQEIKLIQFVKIKEECRIPTKEKKYKQKNFNDYCNTIQYWHKCIFFSKFAFHFK